MNSAAFGFSLIRNIQCYSRQLPRSSNSLLQQTHCKASLSSTQEKDSDCFLSQVESTVESIFHHYQIATNDTNRSRNEILHGISETKNRQEVSIAFNVHTRLQALRKNNDCPRCWMQRKHCTCSLVSAQKLPMINKIYILIHHKEIGLKVDTAKLILQTFPDQCQLVVAGIGPIHQKSMMEFQTIVQNNNNNQCLILFPDDDAQTIHEITAQQQQQPQQQQRKTNGWDLIVIDGTWAQARKLYSKYIPTIDNGGPQRVQLSEQAVSALSNTNTTNPGYQLRRHVITWRQISTFEAIRLFLLDLLPQNDTDTTVLAEQMQSYQIITNQAVKRELGPLR